MRVSEVCALHGHTFEPYDVDIPHVIPNPNDPTVRCRGCGRLWMEQPITTNPWACPGCGVVMRPPPFAGQPWCCPCCGHEESMSPHTERTTP